MLDSGFSGISGRLQRRLVDCAIHLLNNSGQYSNRSWAMTNHSARSIQRLKREVSHDVMTTVTAARASTKINATGLIRETTLHVQHTFWYILPSRYNLDMKFPIFTVLEEGKRNDFSHKPTLTEYHLHLTHFDKS